MSEQVQLNEGEICRAVALGLEPAEARRAKYDALEAEAKRFGLEGDVAGYLGRRAGLVAAGLLPAEVVWPVAEPSDAEVAGRFGLTVEEHDELAAVRTIHDWEALTARRRRREEARAEAERLEAVEAERVALRKEVV